MMDDDGNPYDIDEVIAALEELGPSDGTPLEYAALHLLRELKTRPTWEAIVATQNEKRVFFHDGAAYSVSAYPEGGLEDEEDWELVGWEDELS
jgi:hypothetical protein